MRRLVIDPQKPAASALSEAADVVLAGGVVAIPTDTLYGLAADPFSPGAVARVFVAKGRPRERPMPLIAGDVDQVREHLGPLPPAGERLASAYWPGPLTLLVVRPSRLPADVTGGSAFVGVRVPDHEVARRLSLVCARPLTATSANISGEAGPADPDVVAQTLGGQIDLLLDAGPTRGGPPSTIVDVTGPRPRLIREGAIPWHEVRTRADRA